MTINIEDLVNEVEKSRKEDDNMKFSMDQIVDRPVNSSEEEQDEINLDVQDELGERLREIKVKKENEKIGRFSYDTRDEELYGTYQRPMNSNLSIELLSFKTNPTNSYILDKQNRYIYDGYKLRFKIDDCTEIDKLKYIFISFKKLYRDESTCLSLTTDIIEEYVNKFFQLQICFNLFNEDVCLEKIDNKIEEVKMEIEKIFRIFQIYHYDVKFQFYAC
ncbi:MULTISPECIES: hypothetical protein [unclassified Clostridium]|uniref:hypothetical protein n=1 Tax=unclassified Clostridium TaxID=2614128 RepID=UPI0005FA9879|nr:MULTISPECIES: hypothetical protein [unclassified Clostridium]